MPTSRGARDRDFMVAVDEDAASGAAGRFDGNHTNDVLSWLFANVNWVDEAVPQMLDELMEHTKFGHLAWVVFPKPGYRL